MVTPAQWHRDEPCGGLVQVTTNPRCQCGAVLWLSRVTIHDKDFVCPTRYRTRAQRAAHLFHEALHAIDREA